MSRLTGPFWDHPDRRSSQLHATSGKVAYSLASTRALAEHLCKISQGVSAETPGRVPRGVETGLTGRYGRWVIDLDLGWPTERLDLEPLAVTHAAELAPLLDDASLHEFTGGTPLSAAALAARFARLAVRRSPGGDQLWGNWVMRIGRPARRPGRCRRHCPRAVRRRDRRRSPGW